jgi:uncharacterized membrane protein YeaQ/YmgE (transglycosylase-associated protein family)
MHIIWTLALGLVIGAIAKPLMPRQDPKGLFVTSLLVIAASMTAAFCGRALGLYQRAGVAKGLLASVVSGMSVLVIACAASERRQHRVPGSET